MVVGTTAPTKTKCDSQCAEQTTLAWDNLNLVAPPWESRSSVDFTRREGISGPRLAGDWLVDASCEPVEICERVGGAR